MTGGSPTDGGCGQVASGAVCVAVLPTAALQLATTVARKLLHDVNNVLASTGATAELAALDWPACAAPLAAVGDALSAQQAALQRPLRTLPSRSASRPRSLAAFVAQLATQTGGCLQLDVAWSALPAPPIEEADWVQCLDNVVQNAIDAAAVCGLPLPRTMAVTGWARGGRAAVVLRDDCGGCEDTVGVARGERCRGGAGHLGLGLVVAAAHLGRVGGEVALANAEGPTGRGLTVTLDWPLPRPRRKGAPARPRTSSGGPARP